MAHSISILSNMKEGRNAIREAEAGALLQRGGIEWGGIRIIILT